MTDESQSPAMHSRDVIPQQKAGPVATHAKRASKPSILIVEDEEGIRALLEELLDLEGYTTASADDAHQGLALFSENHYDLVFTDLKLPGMSGATLAQSVKEQKPGTPVVILTGFDVGPNSAELQGVEVDHVLRKPFDMNEFLELVESLAATVTP